MYSKLQKNGIFYTHVIFCAFLAVLGAAELSFWDPNGVVFRPSITTVATFLNRFATKTAMAQITLHLPCDQTFFFKVHTNEVILGSENDLENENDLHLTTTLIW
jgi:hypothetical protein